MKFLHEEWRAWSFFLHTGTPSAGGMLQTLVDVGCSRDLQPQHESVVFNQVETMRDPLKHTVLPRLYQELKCLGLKQQQDLRTCAAPLRPRSSLILRRTT